MNEKDRIVENLLIYSVNNTYLDRKQAQLVTFNIRVWCKC